MSNHFPSLRKYLQNRALARSIACKSFFENNPNAKLLTNCINEIVANLTFQTCEINFSKIKNGNYITDLVVSFCRSHFIAMDLILGCELIEAAVLIRKQLELLSRLNELLVVFDIANLEQKTPNLKHLKTDLKKLYNDYSEVAHSSVQKPLQLLGRIQKDNSTHTPVYPEFQANSYITLQHLAMTVFEYFVWFETFFQSEKLEFEKSKNLELINSAIEYYTHLQEPPLP